MSAMHIFRAPRPCMRSMQQCQRSCSVIPQARLQVRASAAADGGAPKPPLAATSVPKVAFGLPPRQDRSQSSGPETSTGGNGGAGGRLPPPGSSGGAGAGGWGEGASEPEPEVSKGIRWQGWQDRVQADPQFVYKVIVEQIIGVGAAVIGDMSTRPNWGLNELDFVFSTLIVGSILNFALMYLLAPSGAASGAVSSNLISKLFDPRTLQSMGAPSGHIFEPGFSMVGRAKNLAYKSFMFGIIGFFAGIVGTTMSNGLIKVRQATDKNFVLQNEAPDVLMNATAWTLHMGLSSNIRYQALNGLDMALVGVMPPALFKAFVLTIRTMNNILGGMSFVTFARIVGSQKSSPAAVPA